MRTTPNPLPHANRRKLQLLLPATALALLASAACNVQMHTEAAAKSGSSLENSEQEPGPAPTPEPMPEPSGPTGSKHSASLSFHKSAKLSVKMDWQGRSGKLCRAAAPFKFVGLGKASGSLKLLPNGKLAAHGEAQGSLKSEGGQVTGCEPPRTPVPPPAPVAAVVPHTDPAPIPVPLAHEAKKPTPREPVQYGTVPGTPPKHVEPPAPVGPTPVELQTPQPPPVQPPPNVFGYEKPVLGCFEGQVFELAPNTQKLPKSYDSLTPKSVLYACEWNIAPRSWDQGFPGIEQRFEWFAIRYAGTFRTAEAGEYDFHISSDDGARLVIDGHPVVDNDGQHPPKSAHGKVQLPAGDHLMVLEYFQGPRYQINLQLWVTPPGKSEELFTVR